MEKSQINLNHFEFKVTKCKYSSFTKTIYVKSKPEYLSLYNDINLDYSFLSASGIHELDANQCAIIEKLNQVQRRGLITTIYKRLTRAIRQKYEQDKRLGVKRDFITLSNGRKIEVDWSVLDDLILQDLKRDDVKQKQASANTVEKDNLDELFSDDFDFSELELTEDKVDIPILNDSVSEADEFDFSELDEPEPTIDFTYSCPKCKSGILRVKTISGDKYHWTCVNTTNCNSVFADFRGRPIGEDLNYIAEIAVDENTSVPNDDFDFDDDVLSKDFNSEETLIDPKHLNDDFNFDEFDDTEPTPNIVGNESPAIQVFPKGFDFDKHTDSLISEMLQYDKEIYEVFKESQRVLEQKNKLQLQYDNLVKKGDWLYDNINKLQDDYEHAIKSQFNTK